MKLKETNHSYYCSESNFYVNGYSNYGRIEFDTFQDFKDDFPHQDHNYNHCFRFDIKQHMDIETDEPIKDKYFMELFFILQRKGIFVPVIIKKVEEEDMAEIENYLKSCWEYLKHQWIEFSERKTLY